VVNGCAIRQQSQSGIAVRMVFAITAGNLGALARGPVGVRPIVHPERMRRWTGQAHREISGNATHNHAHGVIEVRPPHFIFNIDGNDVLAIAATATT
jgi:hypothetical protein